MRKLKEVVYTRLVDKFGNQVGVDFIIICISLLRYEGIRYSVGVKNMKTYTALRVGPISLFVTIFFYY